MGRKLFGTDGLRGMANTYPITPDMVQKFSMAAGHLFKNDGHRNRVIIAKDTRISGYMLETALTSGFLSVGMDVILVGPMPTPAVSFLIKSLRADLGVMISASHNPYHDNGLKLFDPDGNKLCDEKEFMLEQLMQENHLERFYVPVDQLGRAKRLDDAPGRYVEHVKRSFPKGLDLSGLRIVIDCANGAAYHLAPNILWELGADVVKVGVEPDGFNINQNCGAMHPERLAQKVIETRADIGLALDGDADRLVVCDEQGKVVSGDHVIGMIAEYMAKNGVLSSDSVVVTHMSNMALDEYLAKHGIKVERSNIGDRYVSAKMREINANLGGEQSGHIIFSDYSKAGDGIIAALQILAIMVTAKKKISKIARPFDLNPQVIKNVKFNKQNPLDASSISTSINAIQEREKDCKVFVRKSGTENLIRILVEGVDRLKISSIAEEIAGLLVHA
ncbi:MAG: phosphoglucosamine mutase [Alphaproteobacteria bacterium]|jgi:phosphoglucosamine mutase|nr:phosphoglucosamine mutase [Candidatus Jidaibacter sp.]